MSRNSRWITLTGGAVLVGVLLIALTAGTVLAQRSGPWGPGRGSDWGHGSSGMQSGGMMSGREYGPWSQQDGSDWEECGPDGMMGGMGAGMMGGIGHGEMMGGWDYGDPGTGTRLTLDEATEVVESYVAAYGDSDLAVTEVMEFTGNFYAQVEEQSTGIHAFELLVNPYTGSVHPEPGPNMMWNTKYGHMLNSHMGGWGGMTLAPARSAGVDGFGTRTPSGEVSVSPEEAIQAAQDYLDRVQPGLAADDHVDEFYGYYTLHVLEDGQVMGMLSVNGTTGQVWYHAWHGDFIGMTEGHE